MADQHALLIASHPRQASLRAAVRVRLDGQTDVRSMLHLVAQQFNAGPIQSQPPVYYDDSSSDSDSEDQCSVLGFRQGSVIYPASVVACFPSMLEHPQRALVAVIAGQSDPSDNDNQMSFDPLRFSDVPSEHDEYDYAELDDEQDEQDELDEQDEHDEYASDHQDNNHFVDETSDNDDLQNSYDYSRLPADSFEAHDIAPAEDMFDDDMMSEEIDQDLQDQMSLAEAEQAARAESRQQRWDQTTTTTTSASSPARSTASVRSPSKFNFDTKPVESPWKPVVLRASPRVTPLNAPSPLPKHAPSPSSEALLRLPHAFLGQSAASSPNRADISQIAASAAASIARSLSPNVEQREQNASARKQKSASPRSNLSSSFLRADDEAAVDAALAVSPTTMRLRALEAQLSGVQEKVDQLKAEVSGSGDHQSESVHSGDSDDGDQVDAEELSSSYRRVSPGHEFTDDDDQLNGLDEEEQEDETPSISVASESQNENVEQADDMPSLLFEISDDNDVYQLSPTDVDAIVSRMRELAACIPLNALVQSCDQRASPDGQVDAAALRQILSDLRPHWHTQPSHVLARVWRTMESLFELCDPRVLEHDMDHRRVDVVDWLAAMLFLTQAPHAKKLALAFALVDANGQESIDAARLQSLLCGMALVLFCVHDELLDQLPLPRVQDLARRAASVTLATCFADCELQPEQCISYQQLTEWLLKQPKGAYCLWVHLLDLESNIDARE